MTEFETKDSGERVGFESGMVRDTDEGKTLWHLVASGPMLQRWAELLTRGAVKYDADNWMKASGHEELSRFRASAFRHFMEWFLDLEQDEDHAAAVVFNINGAEYVRSRIESNRPVPVTDPPALVLRDLTPEEHADLRARLERRSVFPPGFDPEAERRFLYAEQVRPEDDDDPGPQTEVMDGTGPGEVVSLDGRVAYAPEGGGGTCFCLVTGDPGTCFKHSTDEAMS